MAKNMPFLGSLRASSANSALGCPVKKKSTKVLNAQHASLEHHKMLRPDNDKGGLEANIGQFFCSEPRNRVQ